MDASHTQTVAQAVAAATQQAQQATQQQHHAPSPAVQPVQHTSAIDNLTCQWQGCGERTDSAESLYDHVCERHVGRKSTNNLNLTCQWGACRTTTVKRDHITSHIRVHVPLKPHKCDFCGKAFKRPQDLKKHVKTHADDSVLLNSPTSGHNGRSASSNPNAPSGYYPASHDAPLNNPYTSYQPSMANGASGAAYAQAGTNGHYAGYGSVSYPNSAAMAEIQSMDTRRRAIEALNDFLGDIKRRAIDPTSYYDVGHRLQGTSLPLPVQTGYNTGYSNSGYNSSNFHTTSLLESFSNGGSGISGGHGAHGNVATHGYSLPLPNARTKTDLQDIDRFLEQLQATVYENSSAAAAAGVQQPGIHTNFTGDFGLGHTHGNFRPTSNSPPSFGHHLSNAGMGNNSMTSAALTPGITSSASSGIDTPVLTPASASSYTSGHSPMSSHSRASFGSGSTGGNMYPSLPAVTSMADVNSHYPTASSAPASGLASGFDFESRRYSGGRLQRQAPASEDTEMPDADDGSRTPKAAPQPHKPTVAEVVAAIGAKEAKGDIDPALRSEDEKPTSAPSTPAATAAEDKRQEEWVENIRVIEALRKWVSERLRTGQFEGGEGDVKPAVEESNAADTAAPAPATDAEMSTVETAKMVAESLAVVERANKQHDEDMRAKEEAQRQQQAQQQQQQDEEAKYPSLPVS